MTHVDSPLITMSTMSFYGAETVNPSPTLQFFVWFVGRGDQVNGWRPEGEPGLLRGITISPVRLGDGGVENTAIVEVNRNGTSLFGLNSATAGTGPKYARFQNIDGIIDSLFLETDFLTCSFRIGGGDTHVATNVQLDFVVATHGEGG